MKKKALMVSTIIGFLSTFEISDIKILQSMGYEVHCACNCNAFTDENGVKRLREAGIIEHHIPFERNPFSKNNIEAYQKLKRMIAIEKYDLVHCHTPVGGVLGRMAAHKEKVPVIIYTAHGFHFYKGAPIKNWLIFFPIEWLCSWWTDILIAINKEDYERARKQLHAKCTKYIPGVGIDTSKFLHNLGGRERIRKEIGLSGETIMLLSIGELNENKNHESVIRAISGIKNLTYVIAGKGQLKGHLERIAKECEVDLRLMGYRSDVADFYKAADAYILPSIREGLNVSLMEAMASGLPCLASRIRGNKDLVDEDTGGYLFNPRDIADIKDAVRKIIDLSTDKLKKLGQHNLTKIQGFDRIRVNELMRGIYTD